MQSQNVFAASTFNSGGMMQSRNGDHTTRCACGKFDLAGRTEFRELTPDQRNPQVEGTQWVRHGYSLCIIPRHTVNTYKPVEVN